MPWSHGQSKISIIFNMILEIPDNLIAHFPKSNYQTIDEVVPYKQYPGGAKDAHNPVYQIPMDSSSNPILILEFDILNEYGFGLKRGHYEIATDPDYTVLMFIQSNEIKAKIPVIKYELINTYGTNYEWPDDKNKSAPTSAGTNLDNGLQVASKGVIANKPLDEKELKKRWKKYKKGQDPLTYFHSRVYMEYDDKLSMYKVVWEKYNIRIIGAMKIRWFLC